jgi:type IV pilus assembly protein PilV
MSGNAFRRKPVETGFTMIEVLVTLVIMMFGLLGIAGLIVKGQKAGSEAYQRNQALLFAMDMADKIKTNRSRGPAFGDAPPAGQLNPALYLPGAPVGAPLGAAAIVPLNPDCSAVTCTNAQAATYDLQTWNNLLAGTQETSAVTGGNVGGIVNARGCIEQPGGAGTLVRISVAWQGNLATFAPITSTCGQGVYGPTDQYRRVVSVDVL